MEIGKPKLETKFAKSRNHRKSSLFQRIFCCLGNRSKKVIIPGALKIVEMALNKVREPKCAALVSARYFSTIYLSSFKPRD